MAIDSARCMWMRGGTSKGGYFLAEDLPADIAERDAFLLRVMGSPDDRQIDGMGGADPLTSKVGVGTAMRAQNYLLIPEEMRSPAVLRRAWLHASRLAKPRLSAA